MYVFFSLAPAVDPRPAMPPCDRAAVWRRWTEYPAPRCPPQPPPHPLPLASLYLRSADRPGRDRCCSGAAAGTAPSRRLVRAGGKRCRCGEERASLPIRPRRLGIASRWDFSRERRDRDKGCRGGYGGLFLTHSFSFREAAASRSPFSPSATLQLLAGYF